MEQSLFFDGKEYVSSKRASEISKYTKDYVGQLCRSGKLVSKLVGRNWYIELASLHGHIGDANSRPKDSVQDFLKKDLATYSEDKQNQKKSFFVDNLKQKHARAAKRDPQLAWREIDRNRVQEKILTDIDVAYEAEAPLFFDDDAPLYPMPFKSNLTLKGGEDEQEISPVSTVKEPMQKADTTIFFKADLVSNTASNKPIRSPIQMRSRGSQSTPRVSYGMDSVVPNSVRPKASIERYMRQKPARRKKTHVRTYGLVLMIVGTALLAGSIFLSLQGTGASTYSSAQVYQAIDHPD